LEWRDGNNLNLQISHFKIPFRFIPTQSFLAACW
jgi:hypothetical protein